MRRTFTIAAVLAAFSSVVIGSTVASILMDYEGLPNPVVAFLSIYSALGIVFLTGTLFIHLEGILYKSQSKTKQKEFNFSVSGESLERLIKARDSLGVKENEIIGRSLGLFYIAKEEIESGSRMVFVKEKDGRMVVTSRVDDILDYGTYLLDRKAPL